MLEKYKKETDKFKIELKKLNYEGFFQFGKDIIDYYFNLTENHTRKLQLIFSNSDLNGESIEMYLIEDISNSWYNRTKIKSYSWGELNRVFKDYIKMLEVMND